MLTNDNLYTVISSLNDYVSKLNWIGYDPYDLKAHPLYRKAQGSFTIRFAAKVAVNAFPTILRRLLRIQPKPHAKAMALFADAYLTMFEITGEASYQDLARGRLEWLIENASPGYSGLAWGLPFDYQGRDYIEAKVPSVVITSIAARAFLHAYQVLGNDEYLDSAISSCQFFVSDVPRYEPNNEQLCFSKAPTVHWYLHNANLMVTATLAKVGQAAGYDWQGVIRRAVNFSISEQREDGAWYYWAPPSEIVYRIDHYHTGFVLRSLDDIIEATGWSELDYILKNGFDYYVRELFDDLIPRMSHGHRYPIDIHSCAEAILCLSQLAVRYSDAFSLAEDVAHWTIQNMRHQEGYYFYRRYRGWTSKIPYMRWGQAWMLMAFSRLMAAKTSFHQSNFEMRKHG